MQKLVVNTLFQEMTSHHNQKDGFREHENWTRIGNKRTVICTANMELRSEFGF